MVVPHSNLPKVPWVTFVEVDAVMMQATSMTSASWALPVLAEAAVAVAHMAPKFLGLPHSGWHVGGQDARATMVTSMLCIFYYNKKLN